MQQSDRHSDDSQRDYLVAPAAAPSAGESILSAANTHARVANSRTFKNVKQAKARFLENQPSLDIRLKEATGQQMCLLSTSMGLATLSVLTVGAIVIGSATDKTEKPTTDNQGNQCPSNFNDDDDAFPAECRRETPWWSQMFNPAFQLLVWSTVALFLVPCYGRRLRIAGGGVGVGVGITSEPHPDGVEELNRRAAERAGWTKADAMSKGRCVCCLSTSNGEDPDRYKLPPFYISNPVLPASAEARETPGSADGILCARTAFPGCAFRCGPRWVVVPTSAIVRARVATEEDMSNSGANGCCSGRSRQGGGEPRTAMVVGRVSCCGGALFTNCCACVASDAEEHIVIESKPMVTVEINDVHYRLPLEELAEELGPGSVYAKKLAEHRQRQEGVSPRGCCGCDCVRTRSMMIMTPHEDEGGAAAVAQRINEALSADRKAWSPGHAEARASAPTAPAIAGFGAPIATAKNGIVAGAAPKL